MNKTIWIKKYLKIIINIFLSCQLICMADELPQNILEDIEDVKNAYRDTLFKLYYDRFKDNFKERYKFYLVASAFDRFKYSFENVSQMSQENQQKAKSILLHSLQMVSQEEGLKAVKKMAWMSKNLQWLYEDSITKHKYLCECVIKPDGIDCDIATAQFKVFVLKELEFRIDDKKTSIKKLSKKEEKYNQKYETVQDKRELFKKIDHNRYWLNMLKNELSGLEEIYSRMKK